MTATETERKAMPTRIKTRPQARSRWRDGLEALGWLSGIGAIGFLLASGTADFSTGAGLFIALGRIAGIIASTMIMVQMVLASRAPIVERVVGHDRALAAHGRLGRIGFFVLSAHVVLVVLGYAGRSHIGLVDQSVQFALHFGGPMTAGVLGFGVLCLVIVTSLVAVRARWRYETWHAVHLFSYAAIALTIPHQFLNGTTFAAGGAATWYWAVLWSVSIGLFVIWRLLRPLARFFRHNIRVADVHGLPDGSTVVTVSGRNLRKLYARPGQYFLWRFLSRDLWDEAHPYSLSRAPLDKWLRITVGSAGDYSAALARLRPGTRVMLEGPLGVFHEQTRVGRRLVLAGAGVGIAPILAMLEGASFAPGECTVILRASRIEEMVHLTEIKALADRRGATVYGFLGPRGFGWTPRDQPATLAELVPGIRDADIYVCGPEPWTRAVMKDARRAGVPEAALHHELFAW